MAYHEYVDRRGNLITRRYNGKRYSAERLPLSDDDPSYEAQAMSVLQNLVDAIGKDAYQAWWGATFEVDGRNVDSYSWRAIWHLARRKLIAVGEIPDDHLR